MIRPRGPVGSSMCGPSPETTEPAGMYSLLALLPLW